MTQIHADVGLARVLAKSKACVATCHSSISTKVRSADLQEAPGSDVSVPKAGGEVTQMESSQQQRAFLQPAASAYSSHLKANRCS